MVRKGPWQVAWQVAQTWRHGRATAPPLEGGRRCGGLSAGVTLRPWGPVGPADPTPEGILMFECSCAYVADHHPRWARRVQAGHPPVRGLVRHARPGRPRLGSVPPAHRAARYESAVSCLTQALYGAPSLLTPAYSRALQAHGPKCRGLFAEEWRDAVVIALQEAHRRAADASTSAGAAAAWPTDVHVR